MTVQLVALILLVEFERHTCGCVSQCAAVSASVGLERSGVLVL